MPLCIPQTTGIVNGSVEVLYDDNAFTPMGPRQTRHYRVHTLYRPTTWATISGAYNDLERHNNTNNSGIDAHRRAAQPCRLQPRLQRGSRPRAQRTLRVRFRLRL
jgi:hypothetical protein